MSVRCGIIQKDIPVVIQYLGIQDWLRVGSAVCDRCVCGGQFDIVYTICDTAESLCL